jgi:hypothetical protein
VFELGPDVGVSECDCTGQSFFFLVGEGVTDSFAAVGQNFLAHEHHGGVEDLHVAACLPVSVSVDSGVAAEKGSGWDSEVVESHEAVVLCSVPPFGPDIPDD